MAGPGLEVVSMADSGSQICAVCKKSSRDVPWAVHELIYDTAGNVMGQRAAGSACSPCRDTMVEACAPQEKEWEQLVAEVAQNPKQRAAFQEWRRRREGKRTLVPKQSVLSSTKVGLRWEDSYTPVDVAELGVPPSRLAECGIRTEHVRDSQGQLQHVVLTQPAGALPPRVVLYYQTEAEYDEHDLRAEAQLRPGQGQEFWQRLLQRTLRARPAQHVPTAEELRSFLASSGQEPCAKTPPSSSASLNSLVVRRPPAESLGGPCQPEFIEAGEEDDSLLPVTPSKAGGPVEVPQEEQESERSSKKPRRGTGPQGSSGRERSGGHSGRLAPIGGPSGRFAPGGRLAPGGGHSGGHSGRPAPTSDAGSGTQQGDELTVENILRGVVPKAKQEIYHCKQRLPRLRKTSERLTILHEEQRIEALSCALLLGSDELRHVPQDELNKALTVVLKECPDLPESVVMSLIQRACSLRVHSPEAFFRACWPWPSAGNGASSEVAPFDPLNPTACHSRLSDDARVELWERQLLKEFLANHMPRGEQGISSLAEMWELVQRHTAPAGASEAVQERIREVAGRMGAVAAAFQRTAVTAQQVAYLQQLGAGKTKIDRELGLLLKDIWWEERLQACWETAAGEAIAAPILERLEHELRRAAAEVQEQGGWPPEAGRPAPDTRRPAPEAGRLAPEAGRPAPENGQLAPMALVLPATALAEAAWAEARTELDRWQKELRKGAADGVLQGLTCHAKAVLEWLLATVSAEEVWCKQAEAWTSRVQWLVSAKPPGAGRPAPEADTLPEQLLSLQQAWDEASRHLRLQAALALLAEGEPAEVQAAFEACAGIAAGTEATVEIMAAFEVWAKKAQTATEVHALLAMLTVATLPVEEQTSLRQQCEASLAALELLRLRGSSPVGSDGLQRLRQATAAWSAAPGGTLLPGLAQQQAEAATAAAELQQQIAERAAAACAQEAEKCRTAIAALAARAGGSQGGASWKAALGEQSSWEDVLREATYHLGSTITSVLDPLFTAAQDAMVKYRKVAKDVGLPGDAALEKAWADAVLQARVTGTEAFFVDVLGTCHKEQAQKKVQQRIVGMSKHQVPTSLLQPLLWERARATLRK